MNNIPGIKLIEQSKIMVQPDFVGRIVTFSLIIWIVLMVLFYFICIKKRKGYKYALAFEITVGFTIILYSALASIFVPDVESKYNQYTYEINRNEVTVSNFTAFVDTYDIKSYSGNTFIVYDKGYIDTRGSRNYDFNNLKWK